MKTLKYITLFAALGSLLLFTQCKDDDDNIIINATCSDGIKNGDETGIDCGGSMCEPCDESGLDFSGVYIQEDQMGRPSINTMFGTLGYRDTYNVTVPSKMQVEFQSMMESKLLLLNPNYTTNVWGLDAAAFSTLLSNDVLWLAETGETTYSNGVDILTGRALGEDVMNTTLQLIYGGADGTENPGLTDDGVPSNDAQFSNSFPYLAPPF